MCLLASRDLIAAEQGPRRLAVAFIEHQCRLCTWAGGLWALWSGTGSAGWAPGQSMGEVKATLQHQRNSFNACRCSVQIHGPEGIERMRAAGKLAAEVLEYAGSLVRVSAPAQQQRVLPDWQPRAVAVVASQGRMHARPPRSHFCFMWRVTGGTLRYGGPLALGCGAFPPWPRNLSALLWPCRALPACAARRDHRYH